MSHQLYLLYGDERFLIRREISRILSENPGAEVLTWEGASPAELVEKISLSSLFSPKRIFILADFDLSSADTALEDRLKDLPSGTILIFDSPLHLDRRKKILKIIEEQGEVIECLSLPEWKEEELIDWVIALAGEQGKTLTRPAAEFLIELVGRNLGVLQAEIEKLAVYLKERKEIGKEDIHLLAPRLGVEAYALAGALREKDRKRALATLNKLWAEREDPVGLLALLANDFRAMYKTKLLLQQGLNQYQIAQQLNTSPYFISKLIKSVPRFTEKELEQDLERLYRADLKIKSGQDGKLELELLVTEISGAER